MRKLLIVLALLASVQVADAQGVAAVKKALDAAVADSQNAKKATKVATWTKLGESYISAGERGSRWRAVREAGLRQQESLP